jgi:molybdopterin synthase sulfur carrier subunit
MTIRVRYFASLRERLGRSEDTLESDSELTVAEVWTALVPNQPLDANTLAAVNREYVETDQRVGDGDEVAFFPPVTGG